MIACRQLRPHSCPSHTAMLCCETEKSTDIDFLWKEWDSNQWTEETLNTAIEPGSADFEQKITKESLWIDPSWVQEDPGRRVLQPQVSSTDSKGGEFFVGRKRKRWNEKDRVEQEEQHALPPSNSKYQNSKEGVTLVAILKACANQKDLHKGSRLHADILRRGLLEKSIHVGNTLVSLYAKCGALAKAQQVFDELQVRDVVSWNSLIAGYAQHGNGEEALHCFERMQREGISPSRVTFICTLKACGIIRAIHKGKAIHSQIVREGLLPKEIFVATALVDMYAKCGVLTKAREVFDELQHPNLVTWNALITGYALHGHGEEAMNCFGQMQREGLSPNEITLICILKACGRIGAADKGKEVHAEITKDGLLENDVLVGTALVDMYAKCGLLEEAQDVLDELQVRNAISWTALIGGYTQHGFGEKALNCLKLMQREKVSPDAATFLCILKACGCLGSVDKGKEVHEEIIKEGWFEKDVLIGTALVDMYAKCGALVKAQKVFDELEVRQVITWTALIAGYAQHGHSEEALDCFVRMQHEGFSPDAVTLTVVFNACAHAGQVEKGQMYFDIMNTSYGISPTLEHYSCMVDLFARAGHFNKAVEVIKKMQTCNYLPLWTALLGACRKWGNVKLGGLAFEHAVQLDEKDTSTYVCMRNICTAAAMQEDADKVEAIRVKNKAWTKPGCCWWTDMSGHVHSFSVGGKRHAQSQHINAKLENIAHQISQGLSPNSHWVSQAISYDGSEDVLCKHSEKLAIACALINTSEGAPIHVVKNMAICGDCHSDISLISLIEKRKLFIRDANCFHMFENGKCACGG